MEKTSRFYITGILFSILVSIIACEKESNFPDGRFIGTWVSTDQIDTLIFLSDNDFVKPFYDGINHSFIYSYTNDSITIQYKGPNKILVQPTTHHFELKRKELLIDFTRSCYGFNQKEIEYNKE